MYQRLKDTSYSYNYYNKLNTQSDVKSYIKLENLYFIAK